MSELDFLGTGLADPPPANIGDCFHANSVFYDRMNSGSVWSDIVYTILEWVCAKAQVSAPEVCPSPRPTAGLTYASYSASYGELGGRGGSRQG